MCDICRDTGWVYVFMFFDGQSYPYEFAQLCACPASAYVQKNTNYRFDQNQIGNHFTLIGNDPVQFIDDRLWSYDMNTKKIERHESRKRIPMNEIKERMTGTFFNLDTKEETARLAYVVGRGSL